MGIVQSYSGLVVARVFLGIAEVLTSLLNPLSTMNELIDKGERLGSFLQLRIF